jgi:hypothetical protein
MALELFRGYVGCRPGAAFRLLLAGSFGHDADAEVGNQELVMRPGKRFWGFTSRCTILLVWA